MKVTSSNKTEKQGAMQDLLKEGYLEIAEESNRLGEEFRTLDGESLQYVD
jgi:hypothetical protein